MARQDFTCIVDGCDRPQHAAELCRMHYARKWRGVELGGPESNRSKPKVSNKAGEDQMVEKLRNAEQELTRAESSYGLASSIGSRLFWAGEMKRIRAEVEELKRKGKA